MQVFVVCCAHAGQIEAHLKASSWAQRKNPKLTVLTAAACLSPGEVLRFVDQKDLIKNDFILVTGDLVASFDLQTALASHKQKRVADRHTIMTMVCIASSDCCPDCIVITVAWCCGSATFQFKHDLSDCNVMHGE